MNRKFIFKTILFIIFLLTISTTAFAADNLEDTGFNLLERTLITNLSKKYEVPEYVIYSVIEQESNFDKHPDNGCGLMQIMCSTSGFSDFPEFAEDMNEVVDNLWAGVYILNYLHDIVGEDSDSWYWTVNAYNGGGTEGYADSVYGKFEKWKTILEEYYANQRNSRKSNKTT